MAFATFWSLEHGVRNIPGQGHDPESRRIEGVYVGCCELWGVGNQAYVAPYTSGPGL